MRLDSSSAAPVLYMNQSPSTPSLRQANALQQAPDVFAVKSMSPASKLSNNVKFGIACGICPACLATAQVKRELDKIKSLSEGLDNLEDTTVVVGKASLAIRKQGALTGADSGTKYIGNEDGTRAQRLSAKDLSLMQQATLPRIYKNDHDGSYKMVANPQHSSGGINNGLRKQLIQGLVQVPHTETITEATSPPALQHELLKDLGKEPIVLGLYHHLAEGKKFRDTGESDPALLGYVSASKLEKHALFVPSLREMPGFEEFGAPQGGMMNIMGMAAHHPEINNIKIAVEPWQHDLKKYIDTLKTDYGYHVRNLSDEKAVPHAYRDAITEAQMASGTQLYEIPLNKLKTALADVSKNAEKTAKGQRDTDLLEHIKLPDPDRDLLFDRLKKKLEILPRLLGITTSRPYVETKRELSDE